VSADRTTTVCEMASTGNVRCFFACIYAAAIVVPTPIGRRGMR